MPRLLILPQIVTTAVFQSGRAGDLAVAFHPYPVFLSITHVGLGNFEFPLPDPFYGASIVTTAISRPQFRSVR